MYFKFIIILLIGGLLTSCGLNPSTQTSSTGGSTLNVITSTADIKTRVSGVGVNQPKGTVTPQQLSTQIVETNSVSITRTTTPSKEPTIPALDWIYGWTPVTKDSSQFGYFDPNENHPEGWNYLDTAGSKTGPNNSVSLAFSHYSDNIAYLTLNEKPELWISDIKLENPQRVWVDESQWLGNIVFSLDLRISWGVADRYVILNPMGPANHTAIFDTKTNVMELWTGNCNIVARSPISNNPVIWCESKDENGTKAYAILERGGLEKTEKEPDILSMAIDWTYSPDGNRLLYASENLDVYLALERSSPMQLSAQFGSSAFSDIILRQNLQWSRDGKKVLVYAYGDPKDLCPQVKIDLNSDELEDRPCWLVFDTNNAEIIWRPMASNYPMDLPWESWPLVHGAALSADGEWLATVMPDFRSGRDYYLYMASLKDDRIKIMNAEEAFFLHWSSGIEQ